MTQPRVHTRYIKPIGEQKGIEYDLESELYKDSWICFFIFNLEKDKSYLINVLDG
jgi:hypothetical protein